MKNETKKKQAASFLGTQEVFYMSNVKSLWKILFFIVLVFAMNDATFGMADEDSLAKVSRTIRNSDGDVTVTLDFLRRPGEFCLTIDYYGFLTQEGIVNAYLSVNGTQREFITMKKELPNRHQQIRIISFHPPSGKKGPGGLKKLDSDELVDYLLFRNAPYYPDFGNVKIELKFFANSRWDGDENNGNGNYLFEFTSPIKETYLDHF